MKLQILRKLIPIACLLVSMNVFAYDFEAGGIYYTISSSSKKTVKVTYKDTNYNSYIGDVVIPSTVINDNTAYTVTSIGTKAFYNSSSLTSVTMPEGITSLAEQSFYGCSELHTVNLPKTLKTILTNSFYNCKKLANIEIPDSVTAIGSSAFNGCSALTTIVIPEGVKTIQSRTFESCSTLTSVSLPSSVTVINTRAFYLCRNLIDITIPINVTTIASEAFAGCYAMTSVSIPKGVTTIAASTFSNCKSLTSIKLHDGITSIGEYAFNFCEKISSINIPSKVTSIGEGALRGCSSLTSITVDENNTVYDSRNNCNAIINKSTNTLIFGCSNTVIPEGVTAIGNYAFSKCDNLTNVSIPEGVTTIGDYTFYNCDSLTYIELPSTLKTIGSYAFVGNSNNYITRTITCKAKTPPTIDSNAFYHTYTTLNVPFASVLAYKAVDGWTEPGFGSITYASHECDGLYYNPIAENEVEVTYKDKNYNSYSGNVVIPTDITVDSIKYNVTAIGDYAFYNCDSLTYIELPSTLKSIGAYAFALKSNLNYITRTVVSNAKTPPTLGSWAFSSNSVTLKVPFASVLAYKAIKGWTGSNITYPCQYCDGLYYNPIAENEVEVTYKDKNYNSYSGNVVIPTDITVDSIKYNVTAIGDYAFYNCDSLSNISIPKGVTTIGNSAFYNCNSLTTIIIPEGVTTIGNSAFERCTALPGTIIFPSSLTTMESNAFYGTKSKICKVNATTPPTITSSSLPPGTSLVLVPVEAVDAYKVADVWSNHTIIAENSCDIEITNNTGGELSKSIYTQTRKSLYNITGIKIHGTLNEADFEKINTNMTSLLHLDISDTDVKEIPANAFKEKPTLVSVKLPKGLKTIGNYAFSGCNVLSGKLELPDSLETIGSYAFQNCTLIDSVLTIPSSVTAINNYAFKSCTRIKSIDMSNATNLKSLNYETFDKCSSLKSVQFPKTLESIGNNVFYGCKQLNNVVLPDSIRYINSYAFSGCKGMTSIDFSACVSLNSISSSAFQGCTGLTLLDLSACESLILISSNAFNGCSTLETVNFPSSLTSIGSNAFANCTNLLQLSVPCTVPPTIANNAEPFAGVDNIACVLSIPTDNFFDYYDANYWGSFVDAENKSEIQVKVKKTTDDENGDDFGSDNMDNDKEGHGHGHKHHHVCNIHYKKHHPHNGGRPSPRAMSLRSITALAETETPMTEDAANAVTASGQSLFVANGEAVTFYLTPEDGKQIESVFYNGNDVTAQMVGNTFTTTAVEEMSISSFVVNLKNASAALQGDINGDGEVNVTDIVALYSYILGNTEGVAECIVDLNGDGEVNVTDIVKLYSLILNEPNNN